MSDNLKGILWIISRGFWSVVAILLIRELSYNLDLIFILASVNIIIVIKMLGWFIVTSKKPPKTKHYNLYIIRALVGLASMGLWMYAATFIPVADLTALNFTAPLFTVVLAVALLKERGTKRSSIGLILGFIGVLIILRPEVNFLGFAGLLALFSALLYAIVNLMVKHLTKHDSPKAIVFYTWIGMLTFSFPLTLLYWNTPNIEQAILLILFAIASNLAIYSMSQAYSKADLVVVMPFEFFGLIFAIIGGYFVYNEPVDALTIIGGTIILSSAIYANKNKKNIQTG